MSISSLTAALPSLTGALPDLFRRADSAPVRADDAPTRSTFTEPDADGARAQHTRATDEMERTLARRAALGPLTYGRRSAVVNASVDAPVATPVAMRGAYLDVRG